MPPIKDENTSFKRKPTTAETRKSKTTAAAEPQAEADLFAATIDAVNGRIVALERVDAEGARHALSAEDKARLAKRMAGATLRRLVEQAFEAGIECALGEDGEKEPAESKTDDELSRMLLQSLVERSRARQLVESRTLNRAIVGTLIGHAATSASPAAP